MPEALIPLAGSIIGGLTTRRVAARRRANGKQRPLGTGSTLDA